MSDELKQAAERYRKPYPRASGSGGRDWDSRYEHQQEYADREKLAEAYLAELDADCTDAARPSWWRGNDHGIRMICDLVNAILDGKDDAVDDGIGIAGEPWESTRRRLLAMKAELERRAVAVQSKEQKTNDDPL